MCNYDGVSKHTTHIADGAFVGSNSSLIAPVSIGIDALVAAGSTITHDIPDRALGIGRAFQVTKPEYQQRKRERAASKNLIESHEFAAARGAENLA